MDEVDYSAEVWKPVLAWEGIYEVSSEGRVRVVRTGLIRKTTLSVDGYPRLGLRRQTRFETRSLHQLVAEAFLGPRPTGKVVNHKDGIKTNARPCNLEWATQGENSKHAVKMGLTARGDRSSRRLYPERYLTRIQTVVGSLHPAAKLSSEAVKEIRSAAKTRTYGTWTQLARKFGVDITTIRKAALGKSWRHILA